MNVTKLGSNHIIKACMVLGPTLDRALELDIRAGRAELWAVDGGSSFAVTRLEVLPDRRELVVCAYAGTGLEAFAAHLYERCAAQGVASIRWHTRRPALARLLKRYAPDLAEYVYRVEVEPFPVVAEERAA
jgi:hypothetical protein